MPKQLLFSDAARRKMLDGVDVDRVPTQSSGVVDAADMLDCCRHLQAAKVGAPKTDTGPGRGRPNRQRNPLAGVKPDSRAGNRPTERPLSIHQDIGPKGRVYGQVATLMPAPLRPQHSS